MDQKREMDIMACRKDSHGVQNGSANTAASSVPLEVILYILAAFTIVLATSLGTVYGILYYLGEA
jgi:hypothetical protein